MKTRVWALVACLMAAPLSAQTVELPLEDARVLAVRAASAGEFAVALELARKLVAVNPDDRTALIVLAVAEPQAGNPEAGWRAGARAWWLSETDAQRYEAARFTALAAANGEWFTQSVIWLRLALLDAPNDAERDRTIADARTVQRRNPWSPSIGLSVVPSNNVNGGSSEDETTGGGSLSESAQALAGIRTSLNFRTAYRFEPSPRTRITAGLRYQPSWVVIEREGEPDGSGTLRGTDFGSVLTEANLQLLQAVDNGVWQMGVATGQFDFGGDPYYTYNRLNLARAFNLTDTTLVRLSAIRDIQDYASAGIVEVRRGTLDAGLTYTLPSGDRVGGGLTYRSSDSVTPNFTFEEVALRASYQWSEPIGPVRLAVNAGVIWADYPTYFELFEVPGGRQDTTFTYGANIGFPEVEFAGFVPGLAVTGSIADSNVTRFQRDTFAVSFTLSSSF